ncbi:MAG: hypothetical protein ACR2PX_22650 [Endozoicomonas sp.]|uniref:hypothetical protein n=1 Tax=Endozoicomonas sp. TaxID=1892382 RepID=UPI003D9BDD35
MKHLYLWAITFPLYLSTPLSYSSTPSESSCSDETCSKAIYESRQRDESAKLLYVFKNMSNKPLDLNGFQGSETTHTSIDYQDITVPPNSSYTVTSQLFYREGPYLDTSIIHIYFTKTKYSPLNTAHNTFTKAQLTGNSL